MGDGDAVGRLVLSGHTHRLFPEHGSLPEELGRVAPEHAPLPAGHAQLIGGTLSQQSWSSRHPQEQTWQLIRLYEDRKRARIVVERIVFTRNNRTGPFLPLADAAGHCAEQMAMPL